MIGIYKITSPNGKIYIGQSVEIARRKSYYKRGKCSGQPLIYNSLKKYGWEAHKFEVLCECKEDELNDLEVYYIELYQSFNSKFGLNLQSGGSVGKHSEETKLKISKANTGKKASIETRKKQSDSWKGRVVSENARKNMREGQKGRVWSEEQKKAVSDGIRRMYANGYDKSKISGEKNYFFGKKHSEETKRKISEARKVACRRKKEINELAAGGLY